MRATSARRRVHVHAPAREREERLQDVALRDVVRHGPEPGKDRRLRNGRVGEERQRGLGPASSTSWGAGPSVTSSSSPKSNGRAAPRLDRARRRRCGCRCASPESAGRRRVRKSRRPSFTSARGSTPRRREAACVAAKSIARLLLVGLEIEEDDLCGILGADDRAPEEVHEARAVEAREDTGSTRPSGGRGSRSSASLQTSAWSTSNAESDGKPCSSMRRGTSRPSSAHDGEVDLREGGARPSRASSSAPGSRASSARRVSGAESCATISRRPSRARRRAPASRKTGVSARRKSGGATGAPPRSPRRTSRGRSEGRVERAAVSGCMGAESNLLLLPLPAPERSPDDGGVENAIVIARNTPRGPAPVRTARRTRAGFPAQKMPRLMSVGVHVSPAPLNASRPVHASNGKPAAMIRGPPTPRVRSTDRVRGGPRQLERDEASPIAPMDGMLKAGEEHGAHSPLGAFAHRGSDDERRGRVRRPRTEDHEDHDPDRDRVRPRHHASEARERIREADPARVPIQDLEDRGARACGRGIVFGCEDEVARRRIAMQPIRARTSRAAGAIADRASSSRQPRRAPRRSARADAGRGRGFRSRMFLRRPGRASRRSRHPRRGRSRDRREDDHDIAARARP